MTSDPILKRALPIALSFIIFISFIEFLITAILIGSYNQNDNYTSDSLRHRLRFLLFTSIWSLIFSSAYLFGHLRAPKNFLFSLASHAGFIFLSWVFWLAGAAAWSEVLSGRSCGDSFLPFARIYTGIRYCHSLKAAEAFAWIEWTALTLVLAYVGLIGSKAVRGGAGLNGPMREVPAAV